MPVPYMGSVIAARRKELGLSQADLAQQAFVSRNYIAQIERAEATNVSTRVLERIAAALQVSVSNLVGGSEIETAKLPSTRQPQRQEANEEADADATSDQDVFIHLAVGLAALVEQDRPYPYPAALRFALNGLARRALEIGKPFPETVQDFLKKCERPVKDWWYGNLVNLPPQIDPRYPLLLEGVLDEQLDAFLTTYDLTGRKALRSSLQEIEAIKDQIRVREMVDEARRDPANQEEYARMRRFIIEHTRTTVQKVYTESRLLDPRRLLLMYETAEHFDHLARHEDAYWVCPYCGGILSWINGRPRCAKPTVCGVITQGYKDMVKIAADPNLLRLRWGIHTRVAIPGKTEIDLFDWFARQRMASDSIVDLQLWPDGDMCDLSVYWDDGIVWHIDVKDYGNPVPLGLQLQGKPVYPGGPVGKQTEGYYVIPDYRAKNTLGYMEQLKQNIVPFAPETRAVTVEALRKKAQRKIRNLSEPPEGKADV
jgi:transcriptional regulator with XRE-family HTH domain